MSENLNAMPPATPIAPAAKKPIWLFLGGFVIGALICGCAVCVGGTLLSPAITARVLPTLCEQRYPDLASTDCETWAANLVAGQPQEYLQCFDGSVSQMPIDPDASMDCLERKGLGPGQ